MAAKIFKRVYVVLLFSFLYVPIAVMIVFSFNSSKSRSIWEGFTFDWYAQLFRNEAVLGALLVSVLLALVSATIATILGTMASVGISRMRRTPRGIIMNLSYIPIINPEIITGVSLMLLFVVIKGIFSALGINFLADNLMGIPSLLIAHITFNLPYVLFNVTPKLRQMDKNMYDAALDLGCNERQAFFKVVLPEIMPAVFSSFLICLTYSIDDFTISYFTAGHQQTLPIAIFSMTRRRVSPEINALSAIMFIAILAIIVLANYRETKAERKRLKAQRMARV